MAAGDLVRKIKYKKGKRDKKKKRERENSCCRKLAKYKTVYKSVKTAIHLLYPMLYPMLLRMFQSHRIENHYSVRIKYKTVSWSKMKLRFFPFSCTLSAVLFGTRREKNKSRLSCE